MSEFESNSLASQPRNSNLRDRFPQLATSPAPVSRYQTLSGVLNVLRQRWKIIAKVGLVVLTLGILVCILIRAYSATTIIEVNKADPTDNNAAQTNGPVMTEDDILSEIQTDISILQTDDGLALQVIKNLNLMQLPQYQKAINPSEKGKSLDEAPRTRYKVLKMFRGPLKVDSPLQTRLITITYTSKDPVLAAKITNGMAQTFIDDTLQRRQGAILKSSGWLQQELSHLKQQVQDSEQKLADYERSTGLAGIQLTGSANGNGGSSVSISPENTVTSRLFTLNQELTTAESSRISAETIYHLLQTQDPESVLGFGPLSVASTAGGSSAITPEAVTLISTLRAQETDLSRQYSAAAVRYGSNNPRLIQIQDQIDTTKAQIKTEVDRIRQRAANDLTYAQRNEASLRAEFAKQENAAETMADKGVKLQMLAQEAFSNRALYQELFSKLQAATLSSGTRATRISVVDPALPEGAPSTPKWGIFLAAILAIGAFLGVSAAFLQESLDETVRSPQDLDEALGLPMLGYIPRLELSAGGSASSSSQLINHPRSPFSEAFRSLRTAVNLQTPPSRNRSFLVTSALGGDGKTTVTYNLGVAFAQQGARVLLIDADLRNPELHRLFQTASAPGVSELCAHPVESVDVPGIVQHGSLPTLFMLPAGERPEFPSELLESVAFNLLLSKVSTVYDYVLIDSPPILAVTDASILASKVGGVIAVVRSRSTTRAVVAGLVQAIQRTNATNLSFVMNDVRHPTLDGFYTYSYSRDKGGHLAANV